MIFRIALSLHQSVAFPPAENRSYSFILTEFTADDEGGDMGATATGDEEFLERGIRLKIEGLYDEAIPLFQAFLAGRPDHARARMELGLAYCFVGFFDESIAELQCAASLEPENAEVRINFAKTLCMLGMNEEARVEFERVLARDPGNEEALKNLAFLS
jgi:Flp pilus assembly protein TadD